MIEAIIAYIQDKGYTAHVLSGSLIIEKEGFRLNWAISQIDLMYLSETVLWDQVNKRLLELEKEILNHGKESTSRF